MLSEHRVDKTDSVRFMIMVTVTLVALHLIYFPRVTVLNDCTLKTLVTLQYLTLFWIKKLSFTVKEV